MSRSTAATPGDFVIQSLLISSQWFGFPKRHDPDRQRNALSFSVLASPLRKVTTDAVRATVYLGVATGSQAAVFGLTLEKKKTARIISSDLPLPRLTKPQELSRPLPPPSPPPPPPPTIPPQNPKTTETNSRAISPKSRPRSRQVGPMFRQFPNPLSRPQHRIFRRRFIDQIAHPGVPTRFDLAG